MNESNIVFESESGRFYAIRVSYGFDVYQHGHSQAAHGNFKTSEQA